MADEQKVKKPDNNKALARLQGAVGVLAIALTANGFSLEDGKDPIEAAIAAVKGQAAQIDELEKKLEATEGARATFEGQAAELGKRNAELEKAVADAERELAELRNDVKDLEERIDQLQADRVAGAPDPVNEAPLERPSAARDFGPTFANLDATELAAMFEEVMVDPEIKLELAFSNGEYEIVELAAQPIALEDLRARGGRYHLVPPIYVTASDVPEKIAGASLIRGGEQIAYCEFPRVLELEPKGTQRFERAITFG